MTFLGYLKFKETIKQWFEDMVVQILQGLLPNRNTVSDPDQCFVAH